MFSILLLIIIFPDKKLPISISQFDILKPTKSRWFSKFLMSFGRNYAHLFET